MRLNANTGPRSNITGKKTEGCSTAQGPVNTRKQSPGSPELAPAISPAQHGKAEHPQHLISSNHQKSSMVWCHKHAPAASATGSPTATGKTIYA